MNPRSSTVARSDSSAPAVAPRARPTDRSPNQAEPHPVLQLQLAIGNRETRRLMATTLETNGVTPKPANAQLERAERSPDAASLLQLQRTMSNRRVAAALRLGAVDPRGVGAVEARLGFGHARYGVGARAVQRKVAISEPGDELEQEADRVAEHVMRSAAPAVQTGCPSCGPDGAGCAKCRLSNDIAHRIARKAATAPVVGDVQAPESLMQGVGSGQPLDQATRAVLEPRFGYDFSRVRVHTGPVAAESARALNALAYTVGPDIVFGTGQYAPHSEPGRRLLAHELTHVIQQSAATDFRVGAQDTNSTVSLSNPSRVSPRVMRKGFESTFEVCHSVLETRKFEVSKGGLRVVLLPQKLDTNVPNCRDFSFGVTLTRSVDWWPDTEIGTCGTTTGGPRSFTFAQLSPGTYYLTIWRIFDHPYCCLQGDILVSDEIVSGDSSGCKRAKNLSALDIVHGALDLAGFIPVLGAVPDGINAAIYVVEGDWANAGLSAVAMVPLWGDGVKLGAMAGKNAIKLSEKAAFRLGEEGIAKGLKEVKAASEAARIAEEAAKVEKGVTKLEGKTAGEIEREGAKKLEKEAAEKLEKEAAEKALQKKIAECEAIYASYEALKGCPSCKPTDTLAERATKIACLTALLVGRQKYLKEKCDYVLAGSILRGSAIAERGHKIQAEQVAKMLEKCAKLPTT